jgi:outer membrane protein OmpA-like peptidoglycan-associated protein
MQLLDVAFTRRTAIVAALASVVAIALHVHADGAREHVPEFGCAIPAVDSRIAPPVENRRVVVTETETSILDVIEFAPGTAKIRKHSFATLDAVAATLQGNPSIELVEVQSHTRGRGNARTHLDLTQKRAEAVVAYLVKQGVAPSRLDAQGYGDTQPISRVASEKNERIAFLILKRVPEPSGD